MFTTFRNASNGLARNLLLRSICFLSLCSSVLAQTPAAPQSERILNFHSDIHVRKDASLWVRETIRVRSEGIQIHHGIYRDFPTRYTDRLGNRYVVGFKVLDATRDDQPEDFHEETQGNGERIYLGSQNKILPTGDHTYTLSYTVTREIGFFQDHDELYWNVTGNGWIFPILHASAAVTLPRNVPVSSVHLDGYTGAQGARGKDFSSSTAADNTIQFNATQPLAPKAGLTIVVDWPKGYVLEPSRQDRTRYFLEDNAPELAGFAGLLLVLLYYVIVWAWVGRDPEKSSIMPIYEPPAGISPAAMRYLVRMGFDEKSLVAAVIDMAVKKYLTIKEKNGTFRLQRSDGDVQALPVEEKAAAAQLFGDTEEDGEEDSAGDKQETVALKPNCRVLRLALLEVKKSLHSTEDKIYFVTNRRYLIPGIVLSVGTLAAMLLVETRDERFILGFLSFWLSLWSVAVYFIARQAVQLWKGARAGGNLKKDLQKQAHSMSFMALMFGGFEIAALVGLAYYTSLIVLLLLAFLVITNFLFHWLLKAPTRAGRSLLDKIEGFRMFLTAVDGDRLNRLTPPMKTPTLFEKYLPYAVALDSELAWAQQFSVVLEQARQSTGYSPTWYVGAHSLTLAAFATSLSGSFTGAITAAASAPGTTSGRGGGFSGGGGGGGGGGGW